MNQQLEQMAQASQLMAEPMRQVSLVFCLACAERVRHLLEDAQVLQCLNEFKACVQSGVNEPLRQEIAQRAAQLANHHAGSKSIDGCGHAAVSATYGVANALAGKALVAASYCAYATVYASGGYAAVADAQAFEAEFTWQVEQLQRLLAEHGSV